MTQKKNLFTIIKEFLGYKKKKKSIAEQLGQYEVKYLRNQLEELMTQKKPYLKARYSIKDMAGDIQVPSYLLSSFLNNVMKTHFSDYLNRFRIEYCEGMMKDDLSRGFSLKELAAKCGFNNRNTFTTAFKKFTGKTPSEYLKKSLS